MVKMFSMVINGESRIGTISKTFNHTTQSEMFCVYIASQSRLFETREAMYEWLKSL